MGARKSVFFLLFLAIAISLASAGPPKCRCLANNKACWPSRSTWSRLNESLGGRLLQVRPAAWPCYEPHFDAQACNIATQEWDNPYWRSDQPGALMENNWEKAGEKWCPIPINGTETSVCYQGSVPVYAVNVSKAVDVQLGVKFASQHNLRLVVKNTGHDFQGRSTAKGSLSIWLHNLKDQTYHDNFVPDKCSAEPIAAVTIGAGVQWVEVYQEAFNRNLVVVGGAYPTVGASGGYVQGGGHGALTHTFGLAADNVVQFKVVTADGKLRVANQCRNVDLFWALRGGGGGTFGVVVETTYKTHPALPGFISATYNIAVKDKATMKTLLTKFTELNPVWSDQGWAGFFLVAGPNSSIPFVPNFATQLTLNLSYVLPSNDLVFAEQSFEPFVKFLEQLEGVEFTGSTSLFSSFYSWYLVGQCGLNCNRDAAGGSAVPITVSSRLIPQKNFDKAESVSQLVDAMINIVDYSPKQVPVTGALVAGGQVAGLHDNAVTPAWREALWLIILPGGWPENATRAESEAELELLTRVNKFLIDITPGSGTYLNEADYNEPDWQSSFFGDHYSRLYSIKQKVDPRGLFVCHHCVGSEDWTDDLNCRFDPKDVL